MQRENPQESSWLITQELKRARREGDEIKPKRLSDLPTVNVKWVRVKPTVKGKRATLAIVDFHADLKHAVLGRDKNMVMLKFAHGEIAVRGFRMKSSANSAAKPASADDAN